MADNQLAQENHDSPIRPGSDLGSEKYEVHCGYWLVNNARCINPRLQETHLFCGIYYECVVNVTTEGGIAVLLYDPLSCGRCKAYLHGGDMNIDPLISLLNWVQAMRDTGRM